MAFFRIKSRRGSGMVVALFVMMLLFAFGMSFLSVASTSLITSKRDNIRARALACAEAGIDQAISFLMTTGPNGEPSGQWRGHTDTTNPDNHTGDTAYTGTLGAGETFTICARTGSGVTAGKIVITSIGTVTHGDATVSRTVRAVVLYSKENVNIWNNVIFGGVGMSGKSINGNVVMRGSVHLLGDGEEFTDVDNDGRWDDNESYTDSNKNGKYDLGEPYIDFDHDGHRDAREPYVDVNGNGTRDPALTVTDIAEEISGTANVGNHYGGMPAELRALLPDPPATSYGGQSVEYLKAKLRVKNGKVNISGSATVGDPNDTTNGYKETLDGCYVSDGYGGTKGTASVYSDNGYSNGYDLGEGLVTMPIVTKPYNGHSTYIDYLRFIGKEIQPAMGTITIAPGTAMNINDANGNSFVMDDAGNATISGIVVVKGDLHLGGHSGPITYSGSGTLVATGNIYVHGDVLPKTRFPNTDVLGLITPKDMGIATGAGDAQLNMALAMYAQETTTIGKQCKIAGTTVSSYFSMTNVPHIYQVPELADHLPPGMPGADPIWLKTVSTESWQER